MDNGMKKERRLYDLMIRKGYPEAFAQIVSSEMHTEFTENRMYGYIASRDLMPLEEVADEMLAIESERDRLVEKHTSEHAQASINEYYRSSDRGE